MKIKTSINFFTPGRLVLMILLAGLTLATILLGSVPPISRDALTHHLYVPRLYLQHGGIYELPDLVFSYYPMNLDMLYTGAMYLGSDILPKYIHMFFGFATGYLIYRYLKQRLPFYYALLGSLFFLSVPIIIKLSITAYVDLGLVFFTTASLLLLFHWIERNYKARYLIFAGLCCGLAVGTKYNGLIVLFLLTLFVPSLYLRSLNSEQKKTASAIQFALLFLACALLSVSPWFIRDWIWTGNPIYPLYNNFFNPQSVASAATSSGENSISGVFATRYALYGENIWQLLSLPVRIFFEGMDDNPRYFDGRLSPFLLLLPLFAFWRGATKNKNIRIEKVALIIFCLLYFFIAFSSGPLRIRYIVPIVPFLVILSMFGLHNIVTFFHKYERNCIRQTGRGIITLIVAVMLLYNARYLVNQFNYVQPFQYISGKISRDAYITKYRSEYPVIQFANQHVGQKTKILCLFLGNRGYYMDFPHTFYVPSEINSKFNQLVTTVSSPTAIQQTLQKSGYRYILLRNDLTNSWLNSLQQQKEIALFFFQHHLDLMYSAGGYSLFLIKP